MQYKINLNMVALAAVVAPSAGAQLPVPVDCPNSSPLGTGGASSPMVNQLLHDALGEDWIRSYVPFHKQAYIFDDNTLSGFYEPAEGRELAEGSHMNKHMLASVLTHHGVSGDAPQPYFNAATGTWEFSNIVGGQWHRSQDEYGPLTHGVGFWAFDQVDGNGQLLPGTVGHGGYRSRIYQGTGSTNSLNDGFSAANRFFVDLGPLPDRAIEYRCRSFSTPDFRANILGNDAVGLASLMVHESFHTTHSGLSRGHGRAPSGLCQGTGHRCDTFQPFSRGTGKGGIVHQKSMGANQPQAQFSCDLVEFAEDWVPLMARLEADWDFAFESIDSLQWTNLVALPFTCGPGDNVIARIAGVSTCSGDVDSVCNTASDCPADETCVVAPGVCSNGSACTVDAECRTVADPTATCEVPSACDSPCVTDSDCTTNGTCIDFCCLVVK